jgi:hypothetical protein
MSTAHEIAMRHNAAIPTLAKMIHGMAVFAHAIAVEVGLWEYEHGRVNRDADPQLLIE